MTGKIVRINQIKCDPFAFEWAKARKNKNVWATDTPDMRPNADLADYGSVDDTSM